MEITSIEARTFDEMLKRLGNAVRMMEDVCEKQRGKKMGEWMDNQEVCLLLDISPRTLQTLRDNGTLAYSQISCKIYYRPEDIQKIIPIIKRRKEAWA